MAQEIINPVQEQISPKETKIQEEQNLLHSPESETLKEKESKGSLKNSEKKLTDSQKEINNNQEDLEKNNQQEVKKENNLQVKSYEILKISDSDSNKKNELEKNKNYISSINKEPIPKDLHSDFEIVSNIKDVNSDKEKAKNKTINNEKRNPTEVVKGKVIKKQVKRRHGKPEPKTNEIKHKKIFLDLESKRNEQSGRSESFKKNVNDNNRINNIKNIGIHSSDNADVRFTSRLEIFDNKNNSKNKTENNITLEISGNKTETISNKKKLKGSINAKKKSENKIEEVENIFIHSSKSLRVVKSPSNNHVLTEINYSKNINNNRNEPSKNENMQFVPSQKDKIYKTTSPEYYKKTNELSKSKEEISIAVKKNIIKNNINNSINNIKDRNNNSLKQNNKPRLTHNYLRTKHFPIQHEEYREIKDASCENLKQANLKKKSIGKIVENNDQKNLKSYKTNTFKQTKPRGGIFVIKQHYSDCSDQEIHSVKNQKISRMGTSGNLSKKNKYFDNRHSSNLRTNLNNSSNKIKNYSELHIKYTKGPSGIFTAISDNNKNNNTISARNYNISSSGKNRNEQARVEISDSNRRYGVNNNSKNFFVSKDLQKRYFNSRTVDINDQQRLDEENERKKRMEDRKKNFLKP